MIVPDVNLLVYAYNSDAPEHERARSWWERSMSGKQEVGLAWLVLVAYIRLATNRAVLMNPLTVSEAVGHIRSWLARSQVSIVQPGPRHLDLFEQLSTAAGHSGRMVTDTHIAALAIEHQAEVHSNDIDFSRFPGLRWVNPLR